MVLSAVFFAGLASMCILLAGVLMTLGQNAGIALMCAGGFLFFALGTTISALANLSKAMDYGLESLNKKL